MNKPTFRAWWIKEKEMHNVCKLDFKNNQVDFCGADTVKIADIILMQSTGLKDKNGVVYSQDDLVKWEGKIYRLILGTYKFELVGFYRSFQDNPFDFFSEGAYLEAEIVGNIHENPELLNEVSG